MMCANYFENWNRYYEPLTGRYLASEPLLTVQHAMPSVELMNMSVEPPAVGGPNSVVRLAQSGHSMTAYSYTNGNPISFIDPDGLLTYLPLRCADKHGAGFWPGGTGPGKTSCEDCKWLTAQAVNACAIDFDNCACTALIKAKAAACFKCDIMPPTPHGGPPQACR